MRLRPLYTQPHETWTSDFMVVDKVTKPGGKVAKCTSMVIESGNPELKNGFNNQAPCQAHINSHE